MQNLIHQAMIIFPFQPLKHPIQWAFTLRRIMQLQHGHLHIHQCHPRQPACSFFTAYVLRIVCFHTPPPLPKEKTVTHCHGFRFCLQRSGALRFSLILILAPYGTISTASCTVHSSCVPPTISLLYPHAVLSASPCSSAALRTDFPSIKYALQNSRILLTFSNVSICMTILSMTV